MLEQARPAKQNITKVQVCCYICGQENYEVVARGYDHEHYNSTTDEFQVVSCRHCGFIYLNPRPDVSELDAIYPPDYYAYWISDEYEAAAKANTFMYRLRLRYYHSKLQKLIDMVRAGVSHTEPLRILDVGCGDGRLLSILKEMAGAAVKTYGTDYSGVALERARRRGHTVLAGDICDLDFGHDFDLVMSNDVIEHVPNPLEHLQRLCSLVCPGGVLQIQTPNIDTWEWRLFRRDWGGYHFPRHWTFFDRSRLPALVEKQGLNIIQTEFFPGPTFWVWTCHALMTRAGLRKLGDLLFPPIQIFGNSFQSFVLLTFFSVIDSAAIRLTGRSANMNVYARRNSSSAPTT